MITQEHVKIRLLVLSVATVFLGIGVCGHLALTFGRTRTFTFSSRYSLLPQYLLDVGIFKLRGSKHIRTLRMCPPTQYELQYADDAAVPCHTASGFQDNLNTLTGAYHRAGNTKQEGRILSSVPHSSTPSHLSFTLHADTLNTTQQFTYLGRILTPD